MHLLIIILQQLLGLLPNGEGKKAPQVELARPPRPNPHGSDPGAFLGVESPRRGWMTIALSFQQGAHGVEQDYVEFLGRLRPVERRLRVERSRPRKGRPPGADDPDVGA